MKTSHPISIKILKRVRGGRRGRVFTSGDFLDLGSRSAVDKALSRLNRRGLLRRIKAGIYYFPAFSKLLNREVPPEASEIASAIGRKNGWSVQASGATAANALGLSTQVPARIVLRTDGTSGTTVASGLTIELRHTAPRFLLGGRHSGQLLQALRWLGPDGVNREAIDRLKKILPGAAKDELRRDLENAPMWLQPKLREIVAD
jgi:uncharacterized protein DUF6088